MRPHAAQNPQAGQIAHAYLTNLLPIADQPHLRLVEMGFDERAIIEAAPQCIEFGAPAAAAATKLIEDAAAAIAGLPLSDAGLVVSQLRTAGLTLEEIGTHAVDIIGTAKRMQRQAAQL